MRRKVVAGFALTLSTCLIATEAFAQTAPAAEASAEPPDTSAEPPAAAAPGPAEAPPATAALDALTSALPAVEDEAGARGDAAEPTSLNAIVLQLGVGAQHSYVEYSGEHEGTAEIGHDPLGVGATAAAAYRMGFALSWALQLRGLVELAPFGGFTVTDEVYPLDGYDEDADSGLGVLLLADVGLLNQPALSGSFHWAVSLTAGVILGSGETAMTTDVTFTELALGGALDLAFWLDRSHTWELGLRTSMVAPVHFGSHLTLGYAL